MKKNNKKLKENPIMGNKKNIKGLKISGGSEDQNEIKAFIIIVIVIAVLIGVIYGLTEIFKKDDSSNSNEIVTGSINYDKASVGTILNRPYKEYYALVYDSDDNKAVIYSTMLTKYMQNSESENYIKIYFVDLGNDLNKDYHNINGDGTTNPKANEVSEFNFGDLTLIKVENGKIAKYIEEYDTIKEILK